MDTGVSSCPDWGALKRLLLEISGQRSLQPVLERIVQGLAELPGVALARIWLLKPGDVCPSCPMRDRCPQEVDCLHLVASAGASRADGADWSRTSGDFRRFPLGLGKVGGIASAKTGLSKQVGATDSWLVRPEWAAAEGITGFAGCPLIYDGELLGVLGMFSRFTADAEGSSWLRMLADHAASAVANARAFEQVERLKLSLELERDYLREEAREAQAYGQIVGESPSVRSILEQIELVAPTDASVLIL
ncbi:MAG TPA: hydrogenase, partial [Planctomycetes bacterium]|nr:hydrogenase [Planctomycetota bacterium]